MQLPPELKAQLQEQKKDCVFCKIIKKEIPSKIVFEDKNTIALLDINPVLKGHTLFLLKEHYPILPYLSDQESAQYFGLLPALVKSIKSALVATAFNIFIANGGAAGQNSPHLTIHLIPREEGDGFFNFFFNKKSKPLPEDKLKPIAPNLQYTIKKYQQENSLTISPSDNIPSYLETISKNSLILYQDEKVLITLPNQSVTAGHIEIYSKLEEKNFEKLSQEDSIYFFTAASTTASLLFQILQLHGTNLILKSGYSDDNKDGKLCIHIIPRMQNDSLQGLVWTPQQPKYTLDSIAEKIKDKTWNVKYQEKKIEPKTEPKKEEHKPEVAKEQPKQESTPQEPTKSIQTKQPSSPPSQPSQKPTSTQDEIAQAIERIRSR